MQINKEQDEVLWGFHYHVRKALEFPGFGSNIYTDTLEGVAQAVWDY